ncbi:hypothetical protein OV079_40685 [Nannocystis pusilla]|uniref:Uncharacterized protein n=1 Tax=Nannocystis pusilla TaxID=889268 RepID=A0A9X3F5C5_9BACT|nr:hypothetical protein [Nannocystis pusilla]MCY1011766.1 hypothetical protein [Nannocystis pusilla]
MFGTELLLSLPERSTVEALQRSLRLRGQPCIGEPGDDVERDRGRHRREAPPQFERPPSLASGLGSVAREHQGMAVRRRGDEVSWLALHLLRQRSQDLRQQRTVIPMEGPEALAQLDRLERREGHVRAT